MSRTAKRFPEIDQARIKLSLSQTILQAQIKCEEAMLQIRQGLHQSMSQQPSTNISYTSTAYKMSILLKQQVNKIRILLEMILCTTTNMIKP